MTQVICSSKSAVLTTNMYITSSTIHIGYTGDIVLAVSGHSISQDTLDTMLYYNVIVYDSNIFHDKTSKLNINNMYFADNRPLITSNLGNIRFILYYYWSLLYSSSSMILLSDYRDVIFQSDPFIHNIRDWRPKFELVAVQEAFFLQIKMCDYTRKWMRDCYTTHETK